MRDEEIKLEKHVMELTARAEWIAAEAFAQMEREGAGGAVGAIAMLLGGVILPMPDFELDEQLELIDLMETLAAERRKKLLEAGLLPAA
ncbi:hypothetical protein HAHE_25030 [Haloferula helveola]|uniref:Uncharacterized protein n=1 Tax=Haloferula helveola TaxID=490095 RepID=A0ABM7REU7_9BACT|nr:hypothetical protein HAHE_25030 [Haloferula helveola]